MVPPPSPPPEMGKSLQHAPEPFFFLHYVTAQRGRVHVKKGKFYYPSTQSLVLHILNTVKTHLITPNGVVLFCFMDQTVQQSSLFLYTGGHRGDHDKR